MEWIGIQLLVDRDEEDDVEAHRTMGVAIRTILPADLMMSVDGVLAVASAADRAPEPYRLVLLIAGLALCIPFIVAGSTLLMEAMDRFPATIVLGAALLGCLSGEMFVADPVTTAWFHARVPEAGFIIGDLRASLVVVVGLWLARRQHGSRKRADTPAP